MILIASASSVSRTSRLAAASLPSSARADASAAPAAGEPIARTLASPPLLPPGVSNITATKTDSSGTPGNPGDTVTGGSTSLTNPAGIGINLNLSETYNYDVVIAGAGSGGVSAALEAARLGSRVALIEESDWIGGQVTAGGVPNMDWGGFNASGLCNEFITKVINYYQSHNKTISTCYWAATGASCFEPSVGQQILNQMINETRHQTLPEGGHPVLDIYLRTKISRVNKSGNLVTGVVTDQNDVFNSKVLIDATEYGDILPLAGIPYRIGNGTSTSPSPNACIQDITYTAVIKKYPNGLPSGFTVPFPPPGYNDQVKANFSLVISRNGNNVPSTSYPYNFPVHNAYRGLPDSSNPSNYNGGQYANITKTVLNWANDYPAVIPYLDNGGQTLSAQYLEDPNYRENADCQAKLKTLQFVYYMQHELGATDWSIANDEGYNTTYNTQNNSCSNIPAKLKTLERNMAIYPYVRESRRMIGLHTLTASEIKRVGDPPRGQIQFPNSVAIGDYPNDLHNCSTNDTLELSLENRNDVPPVWTAGPFGIPFESFIPTTVDGFVAAEKNISQTRLVNGATRLQPITMLTGQAAGTIAALSVQHHIQPRQLNPALVQRTLTSAGAIISPYAFPDVSRDNEFWSSTQMVSARGIMIGYGNGLFGVNDNLTRRDTAITITREFNLPTDPPPASPTFADVPATDYGYQYVEALYPAHIIEGCLTSPLRFCPDRTITRAEYVVMLGRAMGWNLNDASLTPYFADVPTNYWAFPYIQLAYQHHLTSGCSSSPLNFCPDANTTRGQAAVFIANSLTN